MPALEIVCASILSIVNFRTAACCSSMPNINLSKKLYVVERCKNHLLMLYCLHYCIEQRERFLLVDVHFSMKNFKKTKSRLILLHERLFLKAAAAFQSR